MLWNCFWGHDWAKSFWKCNLWNHLRWLNLWSGHLTGALFPTLDAESWSDLFLQAILSRPYYSHWSHNGMSCKKLLCPLITTLNTQSFENVWRKSCHTSDVSSCNEMLELGDATQLESKGCHFKNQYDYGLVSSVSVAGPDIWSWYRIAGNFRGRKLLRIGKNTIFTEKTFTDCSLLQCQRMPRPKCRRENFRV